jgi:hypothetical protein
LPTSALVHAAWTLVSVAWPDVIAASLTNRPSPLAPKSCGNTTRPLPDHSTSPSVPDFLRSRCPRTPPAGSELPPVAVQFAALKLAPDVKSALARYSVPACTTRSLAL